MIEGCQFTRLGVIAEERPDVGFVNQHVIHKTLERLLGAYLNKGAHAIGVERLQPLDPLYGRGDLQLENVLDAFHRVGVEVARDVGYQR